MPISSYQISSRHPPIGMGMSFLNLELVKVHRVSIYELTALYHLIVNYVRWVRKLRLITIT